MRRLQSRDAEQAAMELEDCCRGDPDARVAAHRAGAIESLVLLLNRPSDGVRMNAARALHNICLDCDANKLAAANVGAIPLLAQMLTSPSDKVKAAALDALRNISACERNKLKMAQAGVIPLLTRNLESTSAAVVVEAAVMALWSVSVCAENRRSVADAQAIPPLVQLLCHSSDRIKEAAARTLWAVSTRSENLVKVANISAVRHLVSLLGDTASGGVCEAAIGALWALSFDERCMQQMVDMGALPSLAKLLLNRPSDEIKELAASVLCNVSVTDTNRLKVAESGAIQLLVQLLSSPIEGVKDAAAWALRSIFWTPCIDRIAVVRAGAVQALTTLASKASEKVKQVANDALRKICMDDDDVVAATMSAQPADYIRVLGRPQVTRATTVAAVMLANECATADARNVAVRCGAIDALVRLLKNSPPDVHTAAILALSRLSATPTIRQSIEATGAVWFAPNGRLLAERMASCCVRILDGATGTEITTLRGHTADVDVVLFSDDNATVASGANDASIRVWDAKTGVCKEALTVGPNESIAAAAQRVLRDRVASTRFEASTTTTAATPVDAPRTSHDARPTKSPGPSPSLTAAEPRSIAWNEVMRMTGNVTPTLLLGNDRDGGLYCGRFKGAVVAVKLLKNSSALGKREFEAEMETLSRLQHRNILMLIGWSCDDARRYALLYESAINGSVRDRLDHNNTAVPPLTWPQRHSIMVDIARGMHYAQTAFLQHAVFHLGLRSDAVLLDDRMAAKIGDFCVNRVMSETFSAGGTVFPLAAQGAQSYMCPEYYGQGIVCRTTDVYSYGIIVMELLTARPKGFYWRDLFRRMNSEPNIIEAYLDVVMKPLNRDQLAEASQAARMAVRCMQTSRSVRPTFANVLYMLTGTEGEALSQYADAKDAAAALVQHECYICMNAAINAQFYPCRHSAMCYNCANALKAQRKDCPICYRAITLIQQLRRP